MCVVDCCRLWRKHNNGCVGSAPLFPVWLVFTPIVVDAAGPASPVATLALLCVARSVGRAYESLAWGVKWVGLWQSGAGAGSRGTVTTLDRVVPLTTGQCAVLSIF